MPTLNNDGTAVTLTFAAKTVTSLQLNITVVSATTQNIGLSEYRSTTCEREPVAATRG